MASETNKAAAEDVATNEDETVVDNMAETDAVDTASDDTAPAPDELDDDQEELDPIEALTAERDQLKDQLLRALADTENMRRRTEREMESARKYGHTNFARDLVGAIDNLARAIDAVGTNNDDQSNTQAMQAVITGIELSWTEIQTVIEKHGVKRINPVGEKFDYNLHQAMFEVPTDTHEPGVVVEVVQHGYVLHDRLLRPAMVGVAKAATE